MRSIEPRILLGHCGLLLVLSACAPQRMPAVDCHAGAYRLEGGTVLGLSPLSDPAQLRWRLPDGRTGRLAQAGDGSWTSTQGWTDRPDGHRFAIGPCDASTINQDGRAGTRLRFDVVETGFEGAESVKLRGRLVLPPGPRPVPIAVQVQGSGDDSAVLFNHRQHLFPAHGIGVFVYDKRGTGGSGGRYTQDFNLLAGDAAAALREARRLAGARAGRVGFEGGSQAGWVAPLAATLADADFVAVGYGLADTPLAEDRDEVMRELRASGYGPDVLAKARKVTDATGEVMASGFTRGFDRLDAVRAKYGNEPWWKELGGEFTGELVAHPQIALRLIGPLRDQGTSWRHDPMPVLRALQVPQLWVLAGADSEAPPEETRRRLLALAAQGRPVTLLEFPGTEHGILEFETAADGTRIATREAEGYFRLLVDWISDGRLDRPPYGKAKLLAGPPAPAG